MTARRRTNRSRVLVSLGAAAAAVAVLVVGLALASQDDEQIDATATTADHSTTSEPYPGAAARWPAVFPDPTTSRRFDDPRALAFSYATVLGFSDPVIGEYQGGDSRSGEVEVRAFTEGPPTTMFVRQLEDDTWFVLGAATSSIRLDLPEPDAIISSGARLRGEAQAFEGQVEVRLFADTITDEPIAQTFVTGRSDSMGAFAGVLVFEAPAGVESGTLVLFEASAEDGSTIVATVMRVHF